MFYQHRSGDLAEICTSFIDVSEKIIPYRQFEVLVIERQAIESHKLGEKPKDERYLVVPGFIKRYREKTDHPDLEISDVEPIPRSAHTEIKRLIQELIPLQSNCQIEFFR